MITSLVMCISMRGKGRHKGVIAFVIIAFANVIRLSLMYLIVYLVQYGMFGIFLLIFVDRILIFGVCTCWGIFGFPLFYLLLNSGTSSSDGGMAKCKKDCSLGLKIGASAFTDLPLIIVWIIIIAA